MTLSNHDDVALIPNELLRPILENLAGDRKSLCASSLASNALRHEAQRILFRDVNSGMLESIAHVDFLRTVVASPTRLALSVYAYRVTEVFASPSDKALVEQALKAMLNLKHLNMAFTLEDEDYRRILLGCTFSLETFSADATGGDADEIFDKFLPRQAKLKYLAIKCSENTVRRISDPRCPLHAPKMRTSCPHLISVTGSWNTIKALLPGRKITTLCISGFDNAIRTDETGFERLAPELEYVKALSISNHRKTNPHLPGHSVLYYFPCLTVLELTDFHFDQHMNDIGEVDCLCLVLSQLPELQKLILSDAYILQKLSAKWDQEFIREIFNPYRANKSLTYIDLQISRRVYVRYTRNPDKREKIRKEEVKEVWLDEPM